MDEIKNPWIRLLIFDHERQIERIEKIKKDYKDNKKTFEKWKANVLKESDKG